MKKPIAILINPNAGRGRSGQIAQTISGLLDKLNIKYENFSGNWPVNYQPYSSAWIIGGDGTLNYFINHYPNANIPMAVFKGGTGNDFATFLYGDASIPEMVDIILKAAPKSIDAGICNGQFFMNTIGIGFDGKVLEQMKAIRWLGTFIGYYTAIIKNIVSFKEPLYTIQADQNKIIFGRFLLILVSNAPSTGGGFKVSPLAKPDDGWLNFVSCSPLGVVKRLCNLPAIRKGRHLRFPFIQHSTIQSIQIDCKEPIPAQVDGELIIANSFSCSIMPGYFFFLY